MSSTRRIELPQGSPLLLGGRVQLADFRQADAASAFVHGATDQRFGLIFARTGVAAVERGDTRSRRFVADPTQVVLAQGGAPLCVEPLVPADQFFTVLVFDPAAVPGTDAASLPPTRGTLTGPVLQPGPGPLRPFAAVRLPPELLLRLYWLRQAATGPRDVDLLGATGAAIGSAAGGHGEARSARLEREALRFVADVLGEFRVAARMRRAPRPRAADTHRRLVESAKALVAAAPDRAHPLASIARAVGASPYHLAHIFREEAGLSLHRYLVEFRLALSLGCLSSHGVHLSRLALSLGFATHSHFTVAFRRAFGVPPRAVQRTIGSPEPPARSPRVASSTHRCVADDWPLARAS